MDELVQSAAKKMLVDMFSLALSKCHIHGSLDSPETTEREIAEQLVDVLVHPVNAKVVFLKQKADSAVMFGAASADTPKGRRHWRGEEKASVQEAATSLLTAILEDIYGTR